MTRFRLVPGSPPAQRSEQLAMAVGAAVVVVILTWDSARLHELGRWWAVVACVVTAVLVWRSSLDVAALLGPQYLGVAGVVSVVVSFACVPETDHLRRVAALTIALTVYDLLTKGGLPAAIRWSGLVLAGWAGIHGTVGRQSALVGTMFSWWPLVLTAVTVSWLGGDRVRDLPRANRVSVAVVGAITAAVVSRTGAISPRAWPAVVSVLVAALISVLLAQVVVRLGPTTGRDR